MRKTSAGILVFRHLPTGPEVLLGHPGGPYWTNKDVGAWSIPKGEVEQNEHERETALREFSEETGLSIPNGPLLELSPIRQKGGKIVHAWAVEANVDLASFKSGTFELEWPPKSGTWEQYPEIDQLRWFGMQEARMKVNSGQSDLIDQLEAILKESGSTNRRLCAET